MLQDVCAAAHDVASEIGAEFWVTSSKSGEMVEELFCRVVSLHFDRGVLQELEAASSKQEQQQFGNDLIS